VQQASGVLSRLIAFFTLKRSKYKLTCDRPCGLGVWMQRLTMLASPDGRWLFPESPEFFEALVDVGPDYDAEAFAIKNLGFVKVQILEKSFIEIELYPRNVQLPALLAAQQLVMSSQVKLFRIKYYTKEWQSEISANAEQTIARLSELCAPAFIPPATKRFLVEPRDHVSLFNDLEHPMRPLAQKWRMSFGHFDPNILSIAMKNQLFGRLMIVGIKPRQTEPEWRFIGGGQRWVEHSYQGIGEKVESLPDKEYGHWVSEFYKSVASSGQPRYDLVTAAMQYENEQGKPRRTVQYERLLLPWKTPSDEVLVTSCATLVDGVSPGEVLAK
jgi:hypothetical protein